MTVPPAPVLLLGAAFVPAAVVVRSRPGTARALAAVAGALLLAGVLALPGTPGLSRAAATAGLGAGLVALPWAVLRVLTGDRPLPPLLRVPPALGAATAVVAGALALAGADGALDVVPAVGCCLLVASLVLVGDGARTPGAARAQEQARRTRAVWLVLGLGAAALGTAAAVVLVRGDAAAWAALPAALLVPASLVVAALRPGVRDVRRLAATAVVHGVAAISVAAGFSFALAVVELATGAAPQRFPVLVAALAGAAVHAPLLARLRPHVDTLLFGRYLDPVPVVVGLGRELTAAGSSTSWLAALCAATGLPSAELRSDGVVVARTGEVPVRTHRTSLLMDGELVGELLLGLDPPATTVPRDTALVVGLLATPLAHAVRSARLAADLQRSRERIAETAEAERRRLRHDLHDGLGPVLTGLGYSADAASRLLRTRPDDAEEVLGRLRTDARDALVEVRRIIADLGPADLDGTGLTAALQALSARVGGADGRGLRVGLDVVDVPALPAALELAVHRIVAEALTNAARHAGAAHAHVRLRVRAGVLAVTVTDDGPGGGTWTPGVGLVSMRERAEQLGGRLVAGPGPDGGGRVHAELPVAAGTAAGGAGPRRAPVAGPPPR